MQETILHLLKQPSAAATEEQQEYFINGRNVMNIPATNGYSFGLKLLDIVFTREELGRSLIYPAKSTRPALDKEKAS